MSTPHSARQRARERARDLAQRTAETTGLAELRAREEQLAALAEAVAECTALAGPLADQVGRLEQALVPLLERAAEAR